MALINTPGSNPVDRQDDKGTLIEVNAGWRAFFMAVYTICFAVQQSGPTGQRPLPPAVMWEGRTYIDTTLGLPIWWIGGVWVDATGAPV